MYQFKWLRQRGPKGYRAYGFTLITPSCGVPLIHRELVNEPYLKARKRLVAMAEIMNDPEMRSENNPMPFDGKRMIFGGFSPVVELHS